MKWSDVKRLITDPNLKPPEGAIFIPINVISKKNSKRAFNNNIVNSKASVKYKRQTKYYYNVGRSQWNQMTKGMEPPYVVFMQFHRSNKGRWDFNNLSHMVTDQMVDHGWISDDDSKTIYVVPVFSLVNPKNPGVYLWI